MSEASDKFLIEEYKQLRQEISLSMQRMDSAERNAILASGAIWAWLATNDQTIQQSFIVWLPMFLSLMFALKAIAIRHGLYRLGSYIKNIESAHNLPENLGWEISNGMVKTGYPFRIGLWSILYWSSVVGANFLAALLYPMLIT